MIEAAGVDNGTTIGRIEETMNSVKTAFFLGLLSALLLVLGNALGGRQGMVVALVFAAAMNFFSYWFSDRLVLAMHRAQPVTREQAPQLYEILERLTGRAGIVRRQDGQRLADRR